MLRLGARPDCPVPGAAAGTCQPHPPAKCRHHCPLLADRPDEGSLVKVRRLPSNGKERVKDAGVQGKAIHA